MSNIFQYFVLLSGISIFVTYCGVQFVPERVKVVYMNEKYFYNYTWAVKRYSRNSGYFINIEATIKKEWNNNVTFNLIFNEFLHNEYRRSFVELHYKFCDLLKYEKFIGHRVLEYGIKCPLVADTYRFINLTIPLEEFPSVFPYERARIDIEYSITNTSESMSKVYLYCTFKNIRA
ncbi:uncharacterized protein LOC123881036 [Maniola jurtina]|uniref:uncharacterized protein LOC123881036 n=1 Tax=Maniola jurtina TaxID=191418 RepID=UPI001E689B13|nr:uncharacterized protein LOC123881036 [Maniola jurtina]